MKTFHDRWLERPLNGEPSDTANTIVLEQMGGNPDCFDRWLSAPSSVCKLLALLLDRDLPRMDKSKSDDELRDAYALNIEAMREDFRMWAENPDQRGRVAVDDWRAAA